MALEENIVSQSSGQSLFSEVKKFFRLSSIYASGDILTMGLGLILLPLYTAYLTPGDYGILSIATVITTISMIVLPLGLNGSASKFYFSLQGDERKCFYGTLWIFLIIVPGLFLLLIEWTGGYPFNRFLPQVPFSPFIRIALWTAYLSVAFTTLVQEILRSSERVVPLVGLKIGQFVLAAGFTIWFVAGLKQGTEGALLARLIATLVVGTISAAVLVKFVHFSFDRSLLKQALAYSLPLLPHFLSFGILMASDRIILGWYLPLSEVGIYTIGFQIGSVLMFFLLAGNNSLIPLFGQLNITDRQAVEKLVRIITYYIFGLTFIGLGIALFSPFIINLLTPVSYHAAAMVVPWIVLGYLFMALYLPSSHVITLIAGETRRIGIYTSGAATLNIGLNIWLIPKFGMMAAAITTAATYLVLFITVFLYAQSKQPLPFEIRRIATILLAGVVTFLLGRNFLSTISGVGGLMTIVSLFIFPVILWISGFFNPQELRAALQIYTRIRGSVRLVR